MSNYIYLSGVLRCFFSNYVKSDLRKIDFVYLLYRNYVLSIDFIDKKSINKKLKVYIMKLYHYTNLSSLLGIIQPKRKLRFWGSRYDCMNDPLDYQFAYNRILPVVEKTVKTTDLQDGEAYEIDVKPFVVSFSKKEDDFLMWRMYNSKVALILDSEYFDRPTPNTALVECRYTDDDDDSILKAFRTVNQNIPFCQNIFAYAGRGATFIKHKSFETEGEVRLATWDYYDKYDNKASLPDCKDDSSKEFKSRVDTDGKVVLYKEFEIDGNALAGIIVHTYSEIEFEFIRNAIKSILIQNGYSRDVFSNIIHTKAYPFNL